MKGKIGGVGKEGQGGGEQKSNDCPLNSYLATFLVTGFIPLY